MQQLFGLRYEFQGRNGTSLEFFAEAGLPAGELSRLQTKMLQTGRIPRILPFSAEYKDEYVRLVYDLGSKRMLSQWLRTERANKVQLLQLLVSVAATLGECRSYMLRESGFVVRSEFIFVEPGGTDVSFVYLPLKQIDAPPLGEELGRFAEELANRLPEMEQEAFHALAGFCRSHSFRLADLKRKIIDELLLGGSNGRGPAPVHAAESQIEPITSSVSTYASGPLRSAEEESLVFYNESKGSKIAFSKRLSFVAAASGCIGSAWLWSRYADAPSQPMLHIAIGVTLLAADLTFVLGWLLKDEQLPSLLRRNRSRANSVIPEFAFDAPWDGWEPDIEVLPRWRSRSPTEANRANDRLPDEPSPYELQALHAAHANHKISSEKSSPDHSLPVVSSANEYYSDLRQYTTLLSPPADATVLLTGGDSSRERAAVQAYLEAIIPPFEGRRISLDKPSFIIGRSGELSDLRLDRQGVSRQHAEICCEPEGYFARDLGSTNGTLLNGDPMIRYRSYPLSDGDRLIIAETELRFRLV